MPHTQYEAYYYDDNDDILDTSELYPSEAAADRAARAWLQGRKTGVYAEIIKRTRLVRLDATVKTVTQISITFIRK